jgi:hypothetical protein
MTPSAGFDYGAVRLRVPSPTEFRRTNVYSPETTDFGRTTTVWLAPVSASIVHVFTAKRICRPSAVFSRARPRLEPKYCPPIVSSALAPGTPETIPEAVGATAVNVEANLAVAAGPLCLVRTKTSCGPTLRTLPTAKDAAVSFHDSTFAGRPPTVTFPFFDPRPAPNTRPMLPTVPVVARAEIGDSTWSEVDTPEFVMVTTAVP